MDGFCERSQLFRGMAMVFILRALTSCGRLYNNLKAEE